jgi:hypothetical protein
MVGERIYIPLETAGGTAGWEPDAGVAGVEGAGAGAAAWGAGAGGAAAGVAGATGAAGFGLAAAASLVTIQTMKSFSEMPVSLNIVSSLRTFPEWINFCLAAGRSGLACSTFSLTVAIESVTSTSTWNCSFFNVLIETF